MISGTTIQVELRDRTARDTFGNDVEDYAAPVDVANVVIQPGECEELAASRPEGVRVDFTLHFPKGYTGDLRGARVTLPAPYTWGNPYRVVSVPTPYMEANCPTPWNLPVGVEACDG